MQRIMNRLTVLALLLGGAQSLAAQYFGQNKVQYRSFDFHSIQTEHFDIYYYDDERGGALDAARMAERAYARLSQILHHQFQSRKPIILYASQSDFQQTNVVDASGEGLGGVTEFFKHRAVLPFTGSYAQFEHVLQHEMVHQFQYDVYSRGRPGGGMQTLMTVNPPLWFMEGMAEYLSRGPIDAETAMWLRDAALEGHLPSIEEMTANPYIFPYRYGHALFAYIGEKWGDDVVGEILQMSASSGIEAAVKRALGRSLEDLSADWRDAIQNTFLPQLGDHYRARRIAQPTLSQRRSRGRIFLAPALTPDGKDIAYFGDEGTFFVDLWLADAETGRVKQRLVKSTLNNNYESLRFINSAGSFSPDGRYFAIAAKHKDRDDLVILDVQKGTEASRIRVPLNGLQTPRWSPDGSQLVFTGFTNGVTDLYIVNRDGTELQRLTNDKYADLHPSWSPNGNTIAFVTDRGPATDFDLLRFGNLRIALYHVATGSIEVLGNMDAGKNIDPAWSPDGRSLAFVSDRTGIANVFLYDLEEEQIYQLTDLFTGIQGITPLSPVLSWAPEADRMAFVYYEDGQYSVYSVENPRSLRRDPYRGPNALPVTLLRAESRDPRGGRAPTLTHALGSVNGIAGAPDAVFADGETTEGIGSSIYRSATGFRPSAMPQPAESAAVAPAVTVRALLDSVTLALPDTAEFTIRPYKIRFTADYFVRPTVGYQRDNFGRGVFGGTAVALSDILGNHTVILAGSINGRISEAQLLGLYANQSRRMNWATGFSQDPLYYYGGSSWRRVADPDGGAGDSLDVFSTRIRRFVSRSLFTTAAYPMSRFNRIELGVQAVNVGEATLEMQTKFDAATGGFVEQSLISGGGPTATYVQPSLAHIHDNTLFGYVGPFAGTRSRFSIAPAIGSWQFISGLADYRRYIFVRPLTLAFRGLVMGRYGRDADRFPIFLGSTELIRGYTSGSYRNHECVANPGASVQDGCAELDQLIGSKIAVANVELRFPLARSLVLGILPLGLPPIEGAIFYDVGVAWYDASNLKWDRTAAESPLRVRSPLRSWGASIRANVFGLMIMRFDYAKPLDRGVKKAYWTVSIGPTF